MAEEPLTNLNTPVISERGRVFFALLITGIVLLAVWLVFVLDESLGLQLKKFGLRPRSWEGLRGLFTIHFLHGDIKHIWQNTLAFAVLNSLLVYFYRNLAFPVMAVLAIVPGILLWIGGRPDNHIGLSMFIYGEAAFLFVSGLIRDVSTLRAVALIVAFYYGSLIWYLFPVNPRISWEGHLSGAIVGTWLAYRYRFRGPKRKLYNWEIEEILNPEGDDGIPESGTEEGQEEATQPHAQRPIQPPVIQYHYRPTERGENSLK